MCAITTRFVLGSFPKAVSLAMEQVIAMCTIPTNWKLETRHIAEPRLTYCGAAIERIAMCAITPGSFLARFSAENEPLKLAAFQLSKLNATIIVIGPLWSRERTASNGTCRFEIGGAERTNHDQWQRCNRTLQFFVPAAPPSAFWPIAETRANRVQWQRCNRMLPFFHTCCSEIMLGPLRSRERTVLSGSAVIECYLTFASAVPRTCKASGRSLFKRRIFPFDDDLEGMNSVAHSFSCWR